MKIRKGDEYDAGMPAGMNETTRQHFDMPSVGRYKRHRPCTVCDRMTHPARNCHCFRCKEIVE